jgi:hypothetical protein
MSLLLLLDPERVFSLASGLAMACWLGLAFSPAGVRWAPRVRWIAGRGVPVLMAAVYVALFASHGMGDGGYGSIEAVQRLLSAPPLLVAGWLHFLAFDLFVGAWIAERAASIALPHTIVLPLLALTFMFGHAGLLAFAVVRLAWEHRHRRPLAA